MVKFGTWLHRKYGDLIVYRIRKDGVQGISIPCVLCRKSLEKYSIQWRAHIGEKWYRSKDDDAPPSHATQKQKHRMGFII
jgi:hypothetical protein